MASENVRVQIDVEGLDELIKLHGAINASKIKAAARMAANDSLRWSRTRIRQSIAEVYAIKAQRINDKDKRKGLSIILASGSTMQGQITAGHRPVNLASLQRVRQTNTGVSVEIIKGNRQVIQRAFLLDRSGVKTVFARGQYSAFGFLFRAGKGERQKTTGSDTPIAGINTVSIATAALNVRAFHKWAQPTQDKYSTEVQRQITRLLTP